MEGRAEAHVVLKEGDAGQGKVQKGRDGLVEQGNHGAGLEVVGDVDEGTRAPRH